LQEIRDLFNPEATNLKIVDHPITGPHVKGLTEEVVLSPERVLELMAIGEANRHVAATNMNLRSSRSHTLFKVRL
jgi:centromeric protein E